MYFEGLYDRHKIYLGVVMELVPGYESAYFFVEDDGIFPNNSRMPVILYSSVFRPGRLLAATSLKKLFAQNNWLNAWKNGVYAFHHYHSTSHEVLGIYKGSTRLLLGGEQGREMVVTAGDVLIIPAGVAHKNLEPASFFGCVGAYPDGRAFDFNYGVIGERPGTDDTIARVPFPLCDPVFGENGDLHRFKPRTYDPPII